MYKEQENFIKNLKFYRKKNSISQLKLAELCEVSSGTIGNIEAGITKPSFDLIINIAHHLQITPEKLFYNNDFKQDIFTDQQINYIKISMEKLIPSIISNATTKSIETVLQQLQYFSN